MKPQLNISKNTPKKRKRKTSQNKSYNDEEDTVQYSSDEDVSKSQVPPVRNSDDPIIPRVRWVNKQRVLIFAAKGITYRDRHLMEDLRTMMPHAKADNKKDKGSDIQIINEMCEMKNCNKCIYFEAKKHTDLYMWMSNVRMGPSVKFLVENVHTMNELKLTGNSLRGSRPLLSFDENFKAPHWALMKELLMQVFGTPKGHPKSQPFFDHVYVFSLIDSKIWFRNYQIAEEDGQLTEIGPRFVLNPIKIFEGSFVGQTLWANPKFVTPNQFRIDKKKLSSVKYIDSINQKHLRAKRTEHESFIGDPTVEFFDTKPPEEAVGVEKTLFSRKKKKVSN